jgi:3-keto steroid reductase
MAEEHKIAVITGTSGYLGMAIAQRLIESLPGTTRLTIVVSSRTLPGVKKAVDNLKLYVQNKHATRAAVVEFDYLVFDQGSMVSMLAAARELLQRYKHLDYLFFNSSHSEMTGIDYGQAVRDFFTHPLKAFTIGTFKIQGISRRSQDGISSVFQANVLSPWYLVNEIIPLLSEGGRIIWISSSISQPEYLELDDIGLDKSTKSYEVAKYEIELLHEATHRDLYKKHQIQSWLLHPGVFKSTSLVPTLNIVVYLAMMMMFYICRLCGSRYHCIYPEIAANSPIWTAVYADPEIDDMSVKYGSATDRWGREVLERQQVHPDQAVVKKVYNYIEGIRKEWKVRLKDQIIERHLY